jgi:hypothetical protein
MIGDWFNNTMAFFFVKLLDTMAYGLLGVAYNIFYAVAQLNLFGGNSAGQELYDTITGRFYNVLSIIMIFVFAYQLIMLIIDPEGKEQKASGTIVKDTLISIIAIILCPTIFKYMSLFQNHVLTNNTMGALILGQNATSSDVNPGKTISLMVFMSFYHPNNTSYTTFFDESGNISSDAQSQCETESGDSSTCTKFIDGLKSWQNDTSYGVGTLTGIKDLRQSVGDTMEYMWLLSTAAGILTAWFFFAYSIAMGTRAVKLGVLQLISPIPLVFRIFPQTRKTYETWFGELKKTYLELFIRLGVIFFVIALIQQVPTFINIIFEANDGAGDGLTKCIATVCLILGMLQFAKDAPGLFKALFDNGGNLFKGLNLSPKIRSHVESNPYAMKAIGAGLGAAGGALGAVAKRASDSYRAGGGNTTGNSNLLRSGLAGLTAAPRGVISGARAGFKNSPNRLTMGDTMNAASQGSNAAHTSLENRAFGDTRENIRNLVGDLTGPNKANSYGEAFNTFKTKQGQTIHDWANKTLDSSRQSRTDFMEGITGTRRDYSTATSTAEAIAGSAGDLIGLASVANGKVDKRKTAIEEKVNAGGIYTHKDGRDYTQMYKTASEIKNKYSNATAVKNNDGTYTYVTGSGTAYKVGADNKVISKFDAKGLDEIASKLSSANAVLKDPIDSNGNNKTFTDGNNTYAKLDSSEIGNLLNQATTWKDLSSPNSNETIRQTQTNDGKTMTEYTFADGTKQIEVNDANGNFEVRLNIGKDGNTVTSKAENKGGTTTVTNNIELKIAELDQQLTVENATVTGDTSNHQYNVEQVYDELADETVDNIAKALEDFSDGRKVQSTTMLKSIKDNGSSFSANYAKDAKDFENKFGKSVEAFLKAMSDDNTVQVTKEDAQAFKEIERMMKTEVKRNKANAEAEKRAREAAEAAKPKKEENKK